MIIYFFSSSKISRNEKFSHKNIRIKGNEWEEFFHTDINASVYIQLELELTRLPHFNTVTIFIFCFRKNIKKNGNLAEKNIRIGSKSRKDNIFPLSDIKPKFFMPIRIRLELKEFAAAKAGEFFLQKHSNKNQTTKRQHFLIFKTKQNRVKEQFSPKLRWCTWLNTSKFSSTMPTILRCDNLYCLFKQKYWKATGLAIKALQ